MNRSWPRWYEWGCAWRYRRLWMPEICAALLVACFAVLLSHAQWGDRAIMRAIFDPHAVDHWSVAKRIPWRWFNKYAGIGTGAMTLVTLALLVRSFFSERWRRFRVHLVYIILVIAIGPGLVVNTALKELWGRPRPRQVDEFGGWLPYRSIVHPDKPGRGKSFPCGHCSASFAVVALYFLARRSHPVYAGSALALAAFLGGGMSAARTLAGAHYPSDALMAGALVFLVAAVLYYFVMNIPAREDCGETRAVSPGWPTLVSIGALVAAIGVGGALATPSHRTIWYDGRLTGSTASNLTIRLSIENAEMWLRFGPYENLAVRGYTEGFRGIGGSMKDFLIWSPSRESPTQLTYRLLKQGLFSEFQTAITAHVPVVGVASLRVEIRDSILYLDETPPTHLPITIELSDSTLDIADAWKPYADRIRMQNSRILSKPSAKQSPPAAAEDRE